ncbi:hypothetical protein BDU57DRAFT_522041 [Ampelomyces quisqualis]|uniref:Uncharacterized protein n=1 Tax=Ampelomyces quisqualis TaxID=50730 RepID=A0A6A5QEK4_AMPQU|nr:hypothetical protein BDU57DRAFT_522041 [Ampelomyces quisqualis]
MRMFRHTITCAQASFALGALLRNDNIWARHHPPPPSAHAPTISRNTPALNRARRASYSGRLSPAETMPRPKRTKVALDATRVAKVAPRKHVAKSIAAKPVKVNETVNSFSDDSDGLVTKAKSTRPRRRPWEKTPEPIDEADLIMTGALPAEVDVPIETTMDRTPTSNASIRTRSTKASTKQTSSVAKLAPARSPLDAAHDQSDQAVESSGLGDLTFSSFGSESPAHGTRPPSAIKVGATPAREVSIMALTNFKRRTRQPSLLRMVQQNTDGENNDQSGLDDTDNFDFDDFLPHAESTPLNVRNNMPEDETRNDSGTQVSSSGSRGVKRKLTPVVQVPRSSPFDPPSGADVESARSSSPSLPEVLPTHEEVIEQTQDDAEPKSQTYAPPMSSSPLREASRPVQSPVQAQIRRRGRPTNKAPQYEVSDAEETETPAKAKRTAKSKAQPKLSTAQLKGLLPRRRNRTLRDRDEFDMDSSEVTPLDSDQDELQMPNPRARQRAAVGKLTSPKAAKKTARGKKAAAARASKTYSRRISSDKENEARNNDTEEPTEASIVEHSEKLLAIKKKFDDIDAFELDFETADPTTSSSPFR